jgi:glutamyl-tRNA synthetase
VLTVKDMIERFDLEHLTASPAAINFTKLDHFNGTHIRLLSDADLATRIKPFLEKAGLRVDDDVLMRVTPLVKVRLTTLDEVVEMAGFFFREDVKPNPEELVAKGLTPAQALDAARWSLRVLEEVNPFTAQEAELPMRTLVGELGLSAGQVFGILRVAVTGKKVSPPLFESMEVIGQKTVLKRIRAAVHELEKMS